MAEPINVTDESFQADVMQSDKPVLVDFWAEWCGPCRMIAPSLKEIAAEHSEEVTIAKLDIEENPLIPGRYSVISIPTLMLFKDGEVVARVIGARPKDQIWAQIAPHLN